MSGATRGVRARTRTAEGAGRRTEAPRAPSAHVRILDLLRGELRRLLRRDDDPPDEGPRYGASVSYAPCPRCGEGSLRYDEASGTTRCTACDAVVERGE